MDKSIPCNGKGGNVVSGLSELLHVLASHHLQELSLQCGFKVVDIEKERSAAILSILQHLEKHPDEPLRIRSKRLKEPQSQKFNKARMYPPPRYLHPVSSEGRVLFEVPDSSFYEILIAGLPGTPECSFIPGIVIIGPWTIPADTTIVTDIPYIRFESGLTMQPGAKLYGQHRCGLRLEVSQLNGPTSGGQRPLISTSIRPIEWEFLSDEQVFNPLPASVGEEGDIYLYQLRAGKTLPTTTTGVDVQPGPHAEPENVTGGHGADAKCPPFMPYHPPGDGESLGDSTRHGGQGSDGTQGYSPAPLIINISGNITGFAKFRFDASGGTGGKGGDGGRGQSLQGGNGGNISRLCTWFEDRKPGKGGSVGRPGKGGGGGQGGQGGNGGYIMLTYPPGTNETLLSACVRGGNGGAGGIGGRGGTKGIGHDGHWIDWNGNRETGVPNPAPAISYLEDKGEDGFTGLRGFNGKIVVNGRVKVSGGDRSTVPDTYCYPPPGSDEC